MIPFVVAHTWELICAILGVGGIAGFFDRPYRIYLRADSYSSRNRFDVKIGRMFSDKPIVGCLNPADDSFDEDLSELVAKAETRVAILNASRRSIIPRKRRIRRLAARASS